MLNLQRGNIFRGPEEFVVLINCYFSAYFVKQPIFFYLNVIISCSREIKRRLLLGRKVMTNLDSIFKSGDITLPTKVRLVKAMVFPVVM